MFDFEIKIARDKKEIEQALRLRYEVFRLEMGDIKQGPPTDGLETDIYDDFADHLIVIDKTIDKVVGTYRLILDSKVDKSIGFYSEQFFDMSNIKKLSEKQRIMELGRSCVHKDYRQRHVINFLWSGIGRYIKDNSVRYLFGSVRLNTWEPKEVSAIFKAVKQKHFAGEEFRVYPKPENKFVGLDENIAVDNPREILKQLPPLVKGYLRAGVFICSEPALDSYLSSVVIFILLDTQKLAYSYKQHYL